MILSRPGIGCFHSLRGWPNIVTGVPTLWRQRNFIAAFFRAGTHVVSMDDDVEELFQCMPCKPDAACLDAKLMPLPAGALARIAADAKRRMKEWGAFLWSLNVSDNTFYMRQNIAHNNGLCNGFFWGCLIRHDEDFGRTAFFLKVLAGIYEHQRALYSWPHRLVEAFSD